jgi:hypothetical protein
MWEHRRNIHIQNMLGNSPTSKIIAGTWEQTTYLGNKLNIIEEK